MNNSSQGFDKPMSKKWSDFVQKSRPSMNNGGGNQD